MTRLAARLLIAIATVCAPPAGAHHSYADFDTDTRFTLTGTLTDVQWTNPHILLFISDGAQTYCVEWITLTGADTMNVSREQFTPSESISIVGSRHRNPQVAVVAAVREIDLPDDAWHWERPTGGRSTR